MKKHILQKLLARPTRVVSLTQRAFVFHNLQRRAFASQLFFDSYKRELQEAASQGTDDLITKIEDFSRVLYENLDSVDQAEVAGTLKQVVESIQNRKR